MTIVPSRSSGPPRRPSLSSTRFSLSWRSLLMACLLLCALCGRSFAASQTFVGNKASGFGGTFGNGSLIVDQATGNGDLTFTADTNGTFNGNNIVIYIDSKTGGFTDTSSLTDMEGGERVAVSGFSNNGRTRIDFPSGFTADYAVVFNGDFSVSALYQLKTGSLGFMKEQSYTGSPTITVTRAELGIASGQGCAVLGTLISGSGYRSNETLGSSVTTPASVGDTPNAGFEGSVVFSSSYAVSPFGTANVPPVITSNGGGSSASISVAENTTAVTTVTATDADAGDTLTYSINGGNNDGLLFDIDPATGVLTFKTAPNFESPTDQNSDNIYNLAVMVRDNGNPQSFDTQSLSITVTDVNEAPTAANDSKTTLEDNAVDIDVIANDTDPESSNADLIVAPDSIANVTGGTAVLQDDNRTIRFTPDANANSTTGTFSFTYQTSDGTSDSPTSATATITVTAVNDAPSFTKGTNQTSTDTAGAKTVTDWATDISAGPANESTQNLDFIVTALDTSLFTTQPAISSDGTLTYTPKSGASGSTRVEVQLHDNGGHANDGADTSEVQSFTITITETTKPVPTILTPTSGQTLSINAFNLVTGSATDNVGVTEVFIKVIRTREGVRAYFNGTNFGEVPTLLPVTLANPGAPSTTWSYEVPPALKNALDDGPYAVYAYAQDAAGNLSGAYTRNFNLYSDDVKPVPSILTPTNKQTLSITAFNSITGSATDNKGVTQVQLKLFRTVSGEVQYWNGVDSFTTTPTLFSVTLSNAGGKSTTWNYAVTPALKNALTAGSYLIYAYAKDAMGNGSSAVSRNFFLTGDDIKPSVPVISTPTQGQSLDINNFTTIAGNATDNVGVNQVLLRLYRTRGGVTQYWNGTAFTKTAATFAATLDSSGSDFTTWSYTVSPELRSALDSGAYGIQAYGRDASGNQSAAASRTFKLFISAAPPAFAPGDGSGSSANDS